jgi:hypothetical protein
MPAKARLVPIKWKDKQQSAEPLPGAEPVEVQFNPQSLKLSFANENKGGDQPGGSSKQFVGSGTSKMSVELLFDTTVTGADVRKQSQKVAFFIQAQPDPNDKNKRVPPGISFEWGSFIFRGVVDSMEETLDYFSEEGVPLRATISLNISRQEIEFLFGTPGQSQGQSPGPGAGLPGTAPLQAPRPGDSMQSMAGRNGRSGDWKAIAEANGIDDPLRLNPGALINVNVEAKPAPGVGAQLRADVRAGVNT